MKILLISGHGAGDSGAVSQFGREADETIYMVKEIQKTLSQYAQVDLYPTDRNAYSDAKAGKLAVNFGNYGYVLEVHFNACVNDTKGDGKTTGTEIFVTKAEKTVGVETKIVQAIAAFGLKNRGVKRTNFTVIARAKAAGVSSALLETCFIDDKDDMQRWLMRSRRSSGLRKAIRQQEAAHRQQKRRSEPEAQLQLRTVQYTAGYRQQEVRQYRRHSAEGRSTQ